MWIFSRTSVVKLSLALIMFDGSAAMAAGPGGPVRAWGDLSSIYWARESGNSEERSTNWRNTATIGASSYIWRPWFALIDGGLSLTLQESDAGDQPAAEDEFTSGNLKLGVFPTSRFPFRAYYRENRGEFDFRAFDRKTETTEYGLTQRYRSRDGSGNYFAEYQNNEQDRNGQKQFLSESLLLSGSNGFSRNHLETDIRLDSVDRRSTDEQAESYSFTLDHGYDSRANFTLDNLVSSARVDNNLFDSNSDVDISQVSSFMSWQPSERGNLRLTGGLRATETTTIERDMTAFPSGESESENAVVNLNQGLIYRYSDNLQFSQSINLNSNEADREAVSTTTQSLGAHYTSNQIDTRFGNYAWGVGSTYFRLSGDIEGQESLKNRFNQSLLNHYSLDSGFQLRTNLTQSLNYDHQTEREDEKRVDHSYSMTWSSAAINRQTQIRLLISDSRELNRDDDYLQLVNFQYTGSNRLTRYSQLSGDATLQYSNRSFMGTRSEQSSSNGRLQYSHDRLFRTPGLIFVSSLQLGQRLTESEKLILDPDENIEMSWENSLRYRIGRLETRADVDVVKLGDEYDYIFEFELKRSFGDL